MNTIKRTHFLEDILTPEEFYALKQDKSAFGQSLSMYNEAYIDSVIVIARNTKRFIISKKDFYHLHPTWKNTLEKISLEQDLENPVYVTIEENGTLVIN